jgi:hypothetical protein
MPREIKTIFDAIGHANLSAVKSMLCIPNILMEIDDSTLAIYAASASW